MKIYVRAEDERYYMETKEGHNLTLLDKAKVVNVAKKYNWDTRFIKDSVSKNLQEKNNSLINSYLKFLGIEIINENGYEISLSNVEPINPDDEKYDDRDMIESLNEVNIYFS